MVQCAPFQAALEPEEVVDDGGGGRLRVAGGVEEGRRRRIKEEEADVVVHRRRRWTGGGDWWEVKIGVVSSGWLAWFYRLWFICFWRVLCFVINLINRYGFHPIIFIISSHNVKGKRCYLLGDRLGVEGCHYELKKRGRDSMALAMHLRGK